MGQGGFGISRPCPKCYGRGQIIANPCDKCGGSGQVMGRRTYTVKIPSGIEDGGQIRLKGEGQKGIAGAGTGDMIVEIKIQPHRFFTRKKNDIYCQVHLDSQKAAAGTKIRVKTIHGGKVDVKIPSGMQDGATFRLKGLGIERKAKKGDQFVTVRIQESKNRKEKEKVNEAL